MMLKVVDIAKRLGVSKMTIYRLIRAGQMRAVKVGNLYRVDSGDLESYLRKGRRDAADARDAAGRAGSPGQDQHGSDGRPHPFE